MALRLSALKRRATAASIPAIYINDNCGPWWEPWRDVGRPVGHDGSDARIE